MIRTLIALAASAAGTPAFAANGVYVATSEGVLIAAVIGVVVGLVVGFVAGAVTQANRDVGDGHDDIPWGTF